MANVVQRLRGWLIRCLGGVPAPAASQLPAAPVDQADQTDQTDGTAPASNPASAAGAGATGTTGTTGTLRRSPSGAQLASYDEHLLERSRMQWHLGDWDNLAKLDRDTLQSHPDRAKLALLLAAALQQLGQNESAARYVQLARDFGCSKKLVAQILIAGVHNSLARAATLVGDEAGAQAHFRFAVASGTPGMDSPLAAEARARQEAKRLEQDWHEARAQAALAAESGARLAARADSAGPDHELDQVSDHAPDHAPGPSGSANGQQVADPNNST